MHIFLGALFGVGRISAIISLARWDFSKSSLLLTSSVFFGLAIVMLLVRTFAFLTNINQAVDLYISSTVAGRYSVYLMPPLNPSARLEVRIVGKTSSAEMRMCI